MQLDIRSNKLTDRNKSLVIDLISHLESEDHSVCSRLGSKLYCSITQVLLQCHTWHDTERGVYLLGVPDFSLPFCSALSIRPGCAIL